MKLVYLMLYQICVNNITESGSGSIYDVDCIHCFCMQFVYVIKV